MAAIICSWEALPFLVFIFSFVNIYGYVENMTCCKNFCFRSIWAWSSVMKSHFRNMCIKIVYIWEVSFLIILYLFDYFLSYGLVAILGTIKALGDSSEEAISIFCYWSECFFNRNLTRNILFIIIILQFLPFLLFTTVCLISREVVRSTWAVIILPNSCNQIFWFLVKETVYFAFL